jgi:hypothetical protein
VHFRLVPDRKVRVRAVASNNPKQFEDVKTYYALFQRTFDLESKKWTATKVRPINSEQNDVLESAYQDDLAKHMMVAANRTQVPEDFTGSVFSSEAEKADALYRMMNDVYRGLGCVIPANGFAKVKQEQIAWLKTRDPADSVDESRT